MAVAATRWRWRLLLLAMLALPAAGVALVASAWQALHTEAGTRWWLERAAPYLPGIALDQPQGALLGAGSEFRLARLTLQAGRSSVRIDGLRTSGLQLRDWRWSTPFVHLSARSAEAQSVAVTTTPAPQPVPPTVAPTNLQLPLTAVIDALRVTRLELPGLAQPVEELTARLEVGPVHRVDALALRWHGLRAEGAAQIDAAAPMTLKARLSVRSDPQADAAALPAWARDLTLALQAGGPLAAFDAQGSLAMQSQRLEALARVTPFAALPVAQLDARFEQLDLARLLAPFGVAAAPVTDLAGTAVVQLQAGEPLRVEVQARNGLPGRWDQQRAPVREIDVLAQGRDDRWQIERALLQLATDLRTPAGTLGGSGRIEAGRAEAKLELGGVVLQGLDQRAPPLRLSGPIALKHAPLAAGSSAAWGALDFDARLEGTLVGGPRERAPRPLRDDVRLVATGSATPTSATLSRLAATAGAARLDGKAQARRNGGFWATEATLKLAGFDPSLWLPGEPAAAWRRSRNALNGDFALDVQVPADTPDTAALLAALRGSLRAELTDSALAGQPLALRLQADADGSGRLGVDGEARAADNRASLSLKMRAPSRAAATADERLQFKLEAPALAQLAPLAQALGLGALAGRAQVDAEADGSLGAWLLGGGARGTLGTRGSFKFEALALGSNGLDLATGQWNATLPGAEAAGAAMARTRVEAQAALTRLRLPGLLVPAANLQANGTLAEHRAELRATLRQPQPAGTESTEGEPAPLALDATLAGNWRAGEGAAPQSWRVTLPELALRPNVAASPDKTAAAAKAGATPSLPLVIARDLAFELQQGPQLLRLQAQPGSADVLGAVLRWSRLRWERSGTAEPRLDLQAEVEPFVVAQLLQRLQPDFGWTGDLKVGARASVTSDPTVNARIEIARSGGDLQVSEFGSVQPLGLSDARIELVAEAGTWRMNQLVAGANLGRVVGAQRVRTDPQRLWPAPDAPIEGALRVQVEQLATWGAWVPAGWRLGGALDGTLRIAGRFGAPQWIGEVQGRQLAVRNTLEGVTLTDGQLDARFEGDTARLTTLRFKAGDGEIGASGEARLGEQPQARLQFEAERATVLGRVDRRVVASGKVAVQLDAQTLRIDGDLRADEGLIDASRGDAPTLGDDVTVKRPGDRAAAADTAARRPPRGVELRVGVDLGQRFRIRGRGIDTRLQGQLRLTSPGGKLATHGEVRTDNGTYEAYGQKLAIERGVITFVGDVANPRLDIEAVRANTDTRVGVIVGGSAQSPRVRLFSDPELPDTEKLALLVTGRSYDSLGGTETLLLQRAALALLAGDGADSSFDVARALQLDELSVRQSDGTVRDTVVTLGKQLSDRVYVGYERGLNATAGNWQLIYRIAQRFTLRAQSGEDPAVDLIWIFRWN
ncbi:translocation/assembly module TamB domain-containing protein [uncultured Methylibium sp.]|uniref:translocation/assembly module TamB domain-containing protein n=1 Tax=uncultured Methylibium sp. TaxID=381093 RepID=UPI0025E65D84|nr:translocation/assembly module TamB domain-containing protein [uncultured Methylibium sp.]